MLTGQPETDSDFSEDVSGFLFIREFIVIIFLLCF